LLLSPAQILVLLILILLIPAMVLAAPMLLPLGALLLLLPAPHLPVLLRLPVRPAPNLVLLGALAALPAHFRPAIEALHGILFAPTGAVALFPFLARLPALLTAGHERQRQYE